MAKKLFSLRGEFKNTRPSNLYKKIMRDIEIEDSRPIVAKFGGTSLATPERIRHVADNIVLKNPDRRFIVVSAPGKENPKDTKLTDVFISCDNLAREGADFDQDFDKISSRFIKIGEGLSCRNEMIKGLDEVHTEIKKGSSHKSNEWRGEWLNGIAISRYTGFNFIDPRELLFLNEDGGLNPVSYNIISDRLSGVDNTVIPGFYATGHDGKARTLPRSGSDISGAYITRGVNAALYENWTDVDGVYENYQEDLDDQGHVPIDRMSYSKMYEMASAGASVLHPDATKPLEEVSIPTRIRNTFNPDHPGTLILPDHLIEEQAIYISPTSRQHPSHESHRPEPRRFQIYPAVSSS